MNDQEFKDAYEQYRDMVWRIALTHVKDADTAYDVLQDVMIRLYQYRGSFQSSEDMKRWLIRVSVNRSYDVLRSFWLTRRTDADISVFPAGQKENNDLLREVMALPLKYRTVIYLHYYEGYSCKEISELLHISESAVKMRARRARESLKLELEKGETE